MAEVAPPSIRLRKRTAVMCEAGLLLATMLTITGCQTLSGTAEDQDRLSNETA